MSFLLKIKSYFIDTLLEERNTPQNPVLRLYLSNGQLKLCTQNAVYSYGNYYYNFRDSFTMLDISNRNIRKVLVLGLGTGSIIQLLEKKYKLRADFDAVESDPEIVDMFHKYKNLITPSDIKIFTQDAFQFIQTHVTRYDLICMDIFADNLVPEMFESTEFLMNLKKMMNDKGTLIYNRMVINHSDHKSNERFFNLFKKVFPNAKILKLSFNWMLIAEQE